MFNVKGKSIYQGVVMGPVVVYHNGLTEIKRLESIPTTELKRLAVALQTAKEELKQLEAEALKDAGEQQAAIFEVHRMILEDEDFLEAMTNWIANEHVNAEYAVWQTGKTFEAMFSSMEDAYMRERAADIYDICTRLMRILSGRKEDMLWIGEKKLVLAEDLTPSELLRMEKAGILGFVTKKGSLTSHTAILARTMGIPSLFGADLELDTIEAMLKEQTKRQAILDATNGMLILDPDMLQIEAAEKTQKKQQEDYVNLQSYRDKKTCLTSGKPVYVYANAGSIEDVKAAMEQGAEGIGLLRSEFLYLESKKEPTEEEQYRVYCEILKLCDGKPVIIRTLDIGADKQVSYLPMEQEENPALGMRGIRLCLQRPNLFRTQLRALLRAAATGNLLMMYPFITSVEEVRKIKKIVLTMEAELKQDGYACVIPKQGVMIETPAAALVSDILAKEVDFFSIGTNDLTQYTLALDRQNPSVTEFYEACHPAVLHLIRMTAKHAKQAGIFVGICGELGADLTQTEAFLEMEIDELSVTPSMILPVRRKIAEADIAYAKKI